jgi:hypothetical protein
MSNKSSEKKDPSNQNNMPAAPTPKTVKMREDTIPVIVVNGVYYPSQKLRFKLNDP